MSIAEKLQIIAENTQKVYEQGMIDAPANEENVFLKSIVENTISGEIVLPENFKVGSNGFAYRTGITKLTVPYSCNIGAYGFRYCSNLTELDWYKAQTVGGSFHMCSKLHTIRFHNRFVWQGNDIFASCSAIENLVFYSTCSCNNNTSCNLSWATNLTVESMLNLFNAMETATSTNAVIKLGSTNLAKLTEEQKAIAINKNFALA